MIENISPAITYNPGASVLYIKPHSPLGEYQKCVRPLRWRTVPSPTIEPYGLCPWGSTRRHDRPWHCRTRRNTAKFCDRRITSDAIYVLTHGDEGVLYAPANHLFTISCVSHAALERALQTLVTNPH